MFDGAKHRTGLTNSAADLMRQINKGLGNKKSRATTNIRHMHGSVLPDVLRSNQFMEDLVKIALIPLNNIETYYQN